MPSVEPFLLNSAVSVAPLFVARGLQNKVLEALAAGLPVVVTSAVLSGLPAEVQPGCVSAEDPDDFAKAVVKLLSATPEARRRLAGTANLTAATHARQLLKDIMTEAVDSF